MHYAIELNSQTINQANYYYYYYYYYYDYLEETAVPFEGNISKYSVNLVGRR